ncbi:unnamed protein product [Paramecium primaurelia]|uniref:GOLD domain-containing protein n=1 Tax=Paramecium primaurelia TaxID=5886 RepID=A0A8S1NLU4_PARPR|nr:unnamed protein product [Paramecium primaurelia]
MYLILIIASIFIEYIQCLGIELIDKKPKCVYMNAKIDDQITIKYLVIGGISQDVQIFFFDPYNIQYDFQSNEQQLKALYSGKYRICFKNNGQSKTLVEFDFDILGIDKNYASKNDMIQTKMNLNQIDSDFRWIQMLQKESYHREQTINTNLINLYQQLTISTIIKVILFIVIISFQLFIINQFVKSQDKQFVPV